MNGVKQGGVLSPILLAVYADGLLERLENTGAGCYMGSRFVGALAYADDITSLTLCKSAFSIRNSVCENYAAEYDIMFNGDKSKLLFKGQILCYDAIIDYGQWSDSWCVRKKNSSFRSYCIDDGS